AHANEFLDTLTRSPLYAHPDARGIRAQLLVLGEDLDPRERLARSGASFVIPPNVAAAVAAFVREDDSLLAACAGYYALELGTTDLGQVVDEVATKRPLFEPLGIFHASSRGT
ncbi:MAG TPA: hypothetical protein VGC41_07035, partial [Kofleriaceae bacterium]